MMHRQPVDRIRLGQAGDDVGRHVADDSAILAIGKNDLELVPSEPEHLLAVADDPGQALGDLLQEDIARRMAERVVDLLEPVEVDEHHRAGFPVVLGARETGIEDFGHPAAVGKAGQRVIFGQLRGVLGRSAAAR